MSDPTGAPDTDALLDTLEALVREACETPFPDLYDTHLGEAALTATTALERAGRFRVLWSEEADDEGGARTIGFFPGDNVDESDLAKMTVMLSGMTPSGRADRAQRLDAAEARAQVEARAAELDTHDGDRDENEERSDEEISASVDAYLAMREAKHARLTDYAHAALTGLLANGVGSFQQEKARHERTARDAWAYAHAMLRFDPDFGETDHPDDSGAT